MLHRHILLVEDDDTDRKLLQEAFEEAGYTGELKVVGSGEAALKYLQALSPGAYPALLVLDFNMPGLNGAEILGGVKRLDPSGLLPVVFYSGNMRPLVKELLLGAGAAACIDKPETAGGMHEVVRAILSVARMPSGVRS